ncbi:uncharacterized protein MYCFIDRAFT_200414 [Pseudocercospora fijiensis CIRAD86]|uniref:MYND-type domain-containing protein n=1 Tax=Pseudocercospora fijiensis (strain CIRAD86) TaxID=383855 RepID=M3AKT8_PSEFD|nr:uncharacterized protein MYCFIDRAFT_200414 [Pseudocercospora fijiensis CIRAD86]EME78082.1 hypothetical protein MYCFIDRAFT_200414 [Pseudocercospora fijiensis CIRAD86]
MPILPRFAHLDPSAPLPEGQAWAVMIRPIAATENSEAEVEFYKLPVSLSHHAWTTSEISKRVGFPLQLAQWQHRETSLPNPAIAKTLFFEITQEESFGSCAPAAKDWTGDVVAIRADEKELPEEHVKALLSYISNIISPLLEPIPELRSLLAYEGDTNAETHEALADRVEALTEKVLRKLSPPVFHAYFEQYRAYHAANEEGPKSADLTEETSTNKDGEPESSDLTEAATEEDLRWLDLPSPVQISVGADHKIPVPCSVCDGVEGKMMRCGKCKSKDVWYCGKGCQREDWKGGHKDVCGREEEEE